LVRQKAASVRFIAGAHHDTAAVVAPVLSYQLKGIEAATAGVQTGFSGVLIVGF
jgi:hypothetical protein